MIGIVVITHGAAAAAMLAAVERLVGAELTVGFTPVEVKPGEPKADVRLRLERAVAQVDQGHGVLIACDLHGSTPANCAVALSAARDGIVTISGVNMPMLVKLATVRATSSLDALAKAAVDTAIRSIRIEGGQS